MQIAPLTPDLLAYRVRVTLGGAPLLLDLEWRERAGAWYVGAYTQALDPIAVGRRATPGVLFRGSEDGRLPAGAIYVARLDGGTRDPALGELGREVVIAHLTEAEAAALARGAPPPSVTVTRPAP